MSFQQESPSLLSWHSKKSAFRQSIWAHSVTKLHGWILTKIWQDWQLIFLPAVLCSKRDLNVSVLQLSIKYTHYLKNSLCNKINILSILTLRVNSGLMYLVLQKYKSFWVVYRCERLYQLLIAVDVVKIS